MEDLNKYSYCKEHVRSVNVEIFGINTFVNILFKQMKIRENYLYTQIPYSKLDNLAFDRFLLFLLVPKISTKTCLNAHDPRDFKGNFHPFRITNLE